LEQNTDSDILGFLAWFIGLIFTLLAVFLMILMLWLRSSATALERRKELVAQEWEQLLYKSTSGEPAKQISFWIFSKGKFRDKKLTKWKKVKPDCKSNKRLKITKKLVAEDLPHFLYFWNYLQESLKGTARDNLTKFADGLEIEKPTSKLLQNRRLEKKLLAINTLGNLRYKHSWNDLEKYVRQRDAIISVWALRALFRINQEKALKELLPLLTKREDWSPIIVARILKELGADVVSKPLTELVEKSYREKLNDRQFSRLLSYLVIAHPEDYQPLINKILLETQTQETLIACLRLTKSPEVLPYIRQLFKDERWQVRIQVVLTLGRFGFDEDIQLLIQALNDLEWWVRYRAAGALVSMPSMTEGMLEDLAQTLPNEFSRDILNHVIAETSLKCLIAPSSNKLSG
jgi:hypothetical protein